MRTATPPLFPPPTTPETGTFALEDADWPAFGALLASGTFRRHFLTLLRYVPSCRELLRATPDLLATIPDLEPRSVNALARRLPTLVPRDPRAGLDRLEARAVTWWDADYPAALRDTPWPPPLLFVQGPLAIRQAMSLAIVGTRRASPYGRQVAEDFARTLAGHGFAIISGGAFGVDAAAHRGTLQVGGNTVAVFGCGMDTPYPAQHKELFGAIRAAGGTCLSEYPAGTPPLAEYFPQRNRLVAGLARATLVVEASQRSGALITAGLALEAGREVFAIPGRITDSGSQGTNQLIRDGAGCVTSVEELIEACGLILAKSVIAPEDAASTLEGRERQIYEALSLDQEHIDDVARRLDLPIHQVAAVLMTLELKGYVRSLPGQHVVRSRP